MERRVLCFDPDAGLKRPAPALYPEWADRYRHFSGDLGDDDWAAVAAALAESSELPECWLLVPANLDDDEVRNRYLNISQSIKSISGVDVGDLSIVRWKVGADAYDPPGAEGIRLELVLGGGPEYAGQFLLPLALRVYFEREKFLMLPDDIKGLYGIMIETDKTRINAVAALVQETLNAAGRHCRHEIVRIKNESVQGCYSGWQGIVCDEAFLPVPQDEIRFGWMYRRNIDERRLHKWLNDSISTLKLSWETFVKAVGRWHDDQLRLHNTKDPEVPFDAKKNLAEYEEEFASALLELNSEIQADADVDLDASAARLIRERQQSVGAALRKRPTARLFKWMTTFLLSFSVVVTGVAPAAMHNANGIPWQWPTVAAGVVLLAALVTLIASQRDCWAEVREASKAISDLEEQTASKAAGFKTSKVVAIKRMLLRRNQDILRVQKERRMLSIQKLEYHLRELERHFLILAGIAGGKWATDTGDDPQSKLRFDEPAEVNDTYFWVAQSNNEGAYKIGAAVTPLRNVDRDGRYAGIETICFKARRR